jgi:hypothetical protein
MSCSHCWHPYHGILHMVIRPNHVVECCCKCDTFRQVHRDHGCAHRPRASLSYEHKESRTVDDGPLRLSDGEYW